VGGREVAGRSVTDDVVASGQRHQRCQQHEGARLLRRATLCAADPRRKKREDIFPQGIESTTAFERATCHAAATMTRDEGLGPGRPFSVPPGPARAAALPFLLQRLLLSSICSPSQPQRRQGQALPQRPPRPPPRRPSSLPRRPACPATSDGAGCPAGLSARAGMGEEGSEGGGGRGRRSRFGKRRGRGGREFEFSCSLRVRTVRGVERIPDLFFLPASRLSSPRSFEQWPRGHSSPAKRTQSPPRGAQSPPQGPTLRSPCRERRWSFLVARDS